MGNCKYCGEPAGLFRSKHSECEEQHQQRERVIEGGRKQIAVEVLRAIKGSGDFDGLENTVAEIEQSSFVPSTDRKALLIKGWENSVEQFLEDGSAHPTTVYYQLRCASLAADYAARYLYVRRRTENQWMRIEKRHWEWP